MLKLYVEREAEMKTDVTGKNRGKVLFFRKLEENDIILMRIYEKEEEQRASACFTLSCLKVHASLL